MKTAIIFCICATLAFFIPGLISYLYGRRLRRRNASATCSGVISNHKFALDAGRALLWASLGVALFGVFYCVATHLGWIS